MPEPAAPGGGAAAVRLDDARPVLDVYFRAMAGRRAHLHPHSDPDDPRQFPDTWTTVRLPPSVAVFGTRAGNFDWYKVALAHRSAHYECGSFRFSFDREAACFQRLRPDPSAVERHPPETDLERFLRLFTHRGLALDVFCVLEDLRLDEVLRRRYAGIRGALARVQRHEAALRPALAGLAPRSALAEVLVRLSVGATGPLTLPEALHEPVRQLATVTRALADPRATVEDAAEATLRTYTLITRMPALAADDGSAGPVDPGAAARTDPDWSTAWPEPQRVRLEGDAILATVLEPVGYRDGLGSRFTAYRSAGPLDVEAIFRLPRARDDTATGPGSGEVADGEEREDAVAPPPEPLPHEHPEQGEGDHHHETSGHLHPSGPDSFLYPEYDHVVGGYRDHWCLVREIHPDATGETGFYAETLAAYGHLIPEIRRELERFAPEGLRTVRRTPDGDELDLEAAIEALVDLRAGLVPSELVYARTEPAERDVAVAFLLDMSSSTAERVEAADGGDGAALRGAAVERVHGRAYRRIIDIERESAALLMAALEQAGDSCGVYGFSGSGRADVRLLVLKELDERLSATVVSRLDAVKPVHTTRMGPVVRHATAKLRAASARTKLLMLVSDGRPFDLDYGQEYGEGAEVDYALHDTRRALDEAQRAGVRTFVLTVDQQGADYLRDLCDGLDYEVLADTNLLPARLLRLYRHLTGAGSAHGA